MIEVFYCTPSDFSSKGYATGWKRFNDGTEFCDWLAQQLVKGAVLITRVEYH